MIELKTIKILIKILRKTIKKSKEDELKLESLISLEKKNYK